jgi:nucleotide-binding universal stress UspA family protein
MSSTILLAVALQGWEGFSTHALAARDVAATMARGTSRALHVLSVYTYPQERWRGFPGATSAEFTEGFIRRTDDTMKLKMEDYVSTLKAEGLQITMHLRVGEPREVIVHMAQELNADMLIIGTHSKRSVFDVALGGTAQHVSRHASCAVVLVHSKK